MSDLEEIKTFYYIIILNQGETIDYVWNKFIDYVNDNDNDIDEISEYEIPNFIIKNLKEKYNRDLMMISLSGGLLCIVLNMIQYLNPQCGRYINGLFTANNGSITVIDIS